MQQPESAAPKLEGYARYAIYAAPEAQDPLAAFGAGWLGRDAAGAPQPRLALDGAPRPLDALTADAARYGLHGTLKAPFALAPGLDVAALDAALAEHAAARPPAVAPPLRLSGGLGFLSLRPAGPCPAIDALAAGVVARFARFGAPPDAATLAKRRAQGLSRRQEAYLAAYGYPYVLEEFRFHITLTGRLDAAEAAALRAALEPRLAPVLSAASFAIRSLCLFGDPGAGEPFRLLRRHPLGRPA